MNPWSTLEFFKWRAYSFMRSAFLWQCNSLNSSMLVDANICVTITVVLNCQYIKSKGDCTRIALTLATLAGKGSHISWATVTSCCIAVVGVLENMGTQTWVMRVLISVYFLCQPFLSLEYSTPPAVAIRATPHNKIQLLFAASEFPTALKIQRNATGHLVRLEGASALVLDWLSLRHKFNYSILDINGPPRPIQTLEPAGPNNPGLISYVVRGECDGILAIINATPDRSRRLELVQQWFYTPIAFLIPTPEVSQMNVDAVIKPFQLWVWVMLFVSAASVIIALLYFNCLILKKEMKFSAADDEEKMSIVSPIRTSESIYMYVAGTLLNQGGYISSTLTTIRLVVGAWCLLTFVLLNVYNGILISYVTATRHARPLINSVDDVLADPNIHLILNKGLGADIVFSSAEKGLFKAMGDKLRSYPHSRCNSTQQCVDMIKTTPHRHVYLHGSVVLKAEIQRDYKKTGQCQLTIAATMQDGLGLGWGLAKNSPHLEKFNQGTLELLENGLISSWLTRLEPNTRPCWNNDKGNSNANKSDKKPLVRLTLMNLTGAFLVLAVGSLVSVLAFLTEGILSHHWKRHQQMTSIA